MRSTRPIRVGAFLTAILVLAACDAGAGASNAVPAAGTPSNPAATSTAASSTAASPVATAAVPDGTAIHLVKDCSTFTTLIPSYCEISASDYAPIPVGARVNYLGPLLDNAHFLSSNVLIDDAHGNTATGYCIFDARPTAEHGSCTFWAGTGSLGGFIAIFDVTIDAIGEWHLDGESYGTAPSPGPS